MAKNIYLVGFMGSGKSTVGPLLAHRIGRPFYDLDNLIEEKQKMTVSDIFESRGEEFFRELESQCLHESQHLAPCVMALGGGTFQGQVNQEFLAQHGLTIWLRAPLDLIKERCDEATTRPLARDPRQFETLFELREKYYRMADIHVEVKLKSPQQICTEIQQRGALSPE